MRLSSFVKRVGNIFYNFLNGEYAIVEDNSHPLIKLENEFNLSDFNGYEKDLMWLMQNGFIIENEEMFLKKYIENFINDENLHVVLLPAGESCNFRCKYCYQDHNGKFMSKKDIKNVVEFVNNHKSENVQIDFFGGEPLLNKKGIFEILDNINKNIIASMTTNGYLLDFETFEKLVDRGVRVFQITIDGYEELHNFLRPLSDGSGTYKKIIENLETISSSKKEFNIIFRVNFNENFEIEKFIEEIKSKKFYQDKRFMYLFRPIQSGWNDKFNIVNCRINQTIKYDFYEKLIKNDLLPAEYIMFFTQKRFYCPSGKKNYFIIMPGGEVKKCTVAFDDKRNSVGVLKDGKIYLNENHNLWISDKIYEKEECKSCSLITVCGGKMCPYKRIKGEIKCIDIKHTEVDIVKKLVNFRERM